ncbi:MAG TPA: MFS transporter [Actinomycetes bacterium]
MATLTTAPATAAPRRLFRRRDFRLLWSAYAVSAVGSEVTVLAIPLAAAVLLGASPLQMGLLTAAGTAPYVGFALLAGAWIDRLPRRRPLLVAADVVAATALLTVPIAYLAGALSVGHLVAVELVVGFARVTFRPAFQAHLPDVVRREELTAATGHLRAAESGAMLGGPGLGGALVQALTAPVAVVVDALSFLASALLVGRVQAPERVDDAPAARRRLRVEVAEGLGHMWRDRRMRAIAGAAANVNFFGLMIMALLVVYLTRERDFTPLMVAGVTVAGGVGALAGALLAPRVAARIGRGRTFLLATSVFSVGMFAFPAASGPRWLALAVLLGNEAAVGVAIMLFDVTTSAFVLSAVPRALHGRVNSSLSTVTQGVKPLGALAGGALATAIGMRPALWVAAVGATTTVLWVWCSPFRHEYRQA